MSSFGPVIKVFVIEDTPQMRELLEQMLTLDDFDVVGSAANGAAAHIAADVFIHTNVPNDIRCVSSSFTGAPSNAVVSCLNCGACTTP